MGDPFCYAHVHAHVYARAKTYDDYGMGALDVGKADTVVSSEKQTESEERHWLVSSLRATVAESPWVGVPTEEYKSVKVNFLLSVQPLSKKWVVPILPQCAKP